MDFSLERCTIRAELEEQRLPLVTRFAILTRELVDLACEILAHLSKCTISARRPEIASKVERQPI